MEVNGGVQNDDENEKKNDDSREITIDAGHIVELL